MTTATANGEVAVLVRGLRKSYSDRDAVRGIDFEVARGEVFCLLGPNGAGKTTTVEILEGYRTRTGGRGAGAGERSGTRRAGPARADGNRAAAVRRAGRPHGPGAGRDVRPLLPPPSRGG